MSEAIDIQQNGYEIGRLIAFAPKSAKPSRDGECKQLLDRYKYDEGFDDAEEGLEAAKSNQEAAQKELILLRAAHEYLDWQEKQGECRAIDAELSSREGSNTDVEKALRRAGSAYAQVLDQEILQGRSELEESGAAANATRFITRTTNPPMPRT